MGAYQIVAVGTDGSESSFRAVDRAATIAADAKATLVIICAYVPSRPSSGSEGHVVGSSPAEKTLSDAKERAGVTGVPEIATVALEGDPVEAVTEEVVRRGADLVVVGNRGLNSITGRLLGSVPQDVSRRSPVDVLIVHTT